MREDTVKKSYQKNYCLSIQKYIFQSIRIINFKSNIVTIYKQPDVYIYLKIQTRKIS